MTNTEKNLAIVIDNMSILCGKGKKEVKELFASIGYNTLEPVINVKFSQVWTWRGQSHFTKTTFLLAYDPKGNCRAWSISGNHFLVYKARTFDELVNHYKFDFVSPTLYEYINKE